MTDTEIIQKFKLTGTPDAVAAQVAFIRRTLDKWGSPAGRERAAKARAEIKAGRYRVL